jgi:serine/threonine protein kinase
MPLTTSTRLGPYEIIAPLGAGGMGEVYRAKDTRLGREVAIKVLPAHLIENAEVRARFEREARTISSLNHPNICTLFDVGRAPGEAGSGDTDYLVMELVEGETLAQRIARGPLPTADLLKLATQIADALDRAHRAGIVHRDFKPGNVMITKAGAKLMDFGLARNATMPGMSPASGSTGVTIAQLTQSPTLASPLTQQGALIGTFLYMAPEQLEGKEADARSDIWAFGCVLYEMATGRRAFDGKSQASLVGAVMNSEPAPLSASGASTPPGLDALIRACLAKDPDERIQTAHDIKLQLSWLAQSGSGATGPIDLPKRRRSHETIAWTVAGLAIASAAFFAWRGGLGGANDASKQQLVFTVPIPPSVTPQFMPRVSPDGKIIAFIGQDSLNRTLVWLRPLNSLVANPLPGTEGSRAPFWSPDSRYLAFVADGKLKKVAVAGGPPQVICDAPTGSDGSWGRSNVILFDGQGADPIYRVNAGGGIKAAAIPGDSVKQVGWPAFLPDGKHFLYSGVGNTGLSKTFVGTLGSTAGKELAIEGSRIEYSPDGYVLLARDRTLLAQKFDVGGLKLVGEPFPIAENLPVGGNGAANFTVSGNGILVYRATGSTMNRLIWLDRSGHELSEVAAAADYRAPALSPDGTKIAIRRRDGNGSNIDVWVIEPARGTTTRFTFDPGDDSNPIWSPDGSKIAWSGVRGGREAIWVKTANGAGSEETVTDAGTNSVLLDWSHDGRYLLYSNFGSNLTDVSAFDFDTRKSTVVLASRFNEMRARLSPDGHWIAYQSDESGVFEIYVTSFPISSGKWQISTRGGGEPCWSRDGKELFYLSPDAKFMSVPVTTGAAFNPGTPQALFRVQTEPGLRRNVYCPSPDGKKFLFLVPSGENETPMTVMVNWRGDKGGK